MTGMAYEAFSNLSFYLVAVPRKSRLRGPWTLGGNHAMTASPVTLSSWIFRQRGKILVSATARVSRWPLLGPVTSSWKEV